MSSVTVGLNKNGVWYASAYLGRDERTGTVRRPYKTLPQAKTEEEAVELANEWLANMADSTLVDLLNTYIDTREANGEIKPNTVRTYRLYANKHVARVVKNRMCNEITPAEATHMEQMLLMGDSRHKPLSKNTVNRIHWFLNSAYRYFRTTLGMACDNPMSDARHPEQELIEAKAMDDADFASLKTWLDERLADRGDARAAAYAFATWMALYTGMRQGEICALRRRDFSPVRGLLHVGGTVTEVGGLKRQDLPKTKSSRRNIAVTHEQVGAIEAWMAWVNGAIPGLKADDPLIPCNGKWMRPSSLGHWFRRVRDEIGLARFVTFHTIRHTHATYLLQSGADQRTLQERLGHSDVETTLRYYGHVLEGRDAAAADAFEKLSKTVV